MAHNLKHLKRQSGMNQEEWDLYMQYGSPPKSMSYEDASKLWKQRRDLTTRSGYVPPEDHQEFEYVGAGNEGPYESDFEYVGYGNQPREDFEYVGYGNEPIKERTDDRNIEYNQAVAEYNAKKEAEGIVRPHFSGGIRGEQGNMYVKGMTDDIRRADYDTDEAFTEALVRRRHEKNHPNPYNDAMGAGYYLKAAKTHYIDKNILKQVDPYGLYPNLLENMPDENQNYFATPSLSGNVVIVKKADGTTKKIVVNPNEGPVLNEGETIVNTEDKLEDDPYVAPEDQEDEWGNEPTGYGDFPGTPTKPPPIRNPMARNPMEQNPMAYNPMTNFGLLRPGTFNVPRALPTSDELN